MSSPIDLDGLQTYIRRLFAPEDDVLRSFEEQARGAGLPLIQVEPEQGKLLALLVTISRASRILEIGTLGGYSTTWMARAMPEGGRIVSLEKEPKHAEFARAYLRRSEVEQSVEIIVGAALDTLPSLLDREDPQFDLVFIDADKRSYPAYLDWALRLVRPGGIIVADNVLRGGQVLAPGDDPDLNGLAAFNQHVAASPLLESLLLPDLDGDGMVVAVLKEQAA